MEVDDAAGVVLGSSGVDIIPKRYRRAPGVLSLTDQMEEALVPCLQRVVGLPSSSACGKDAARVTATITGDPFSRSRAIVVQYGTRRDESAILWVSNRGGLLCSCFSGTQNASFLSSSSRSAECLHTELINRCLPIAGVEYARFRRRMRLTVDAADFAVPRQVGNNFVLFVLYRKVYSIVTFSGKFATCVAPGCRSFSRRCGHVSVARRVRANLPVTKVGPDAGEELRFNSKSSAAGRRLHHLTSEDEDDGLEKLPTDTERSTVDPPESMLSERVMRNMLPCTIEVELGAMWCRTADMRSMLASCPRRGDEDAASAFKAMMTGFSAGVRRRLVADTRNTLVESHCGSCGQARGSRHAVSAEAAILFTHHPTAPALWVCVHCVLSMYVAYSSLITHSSRGAWRTTVSPSVCVLSVIRFGLGNF